MQTEFVANELIQPLLMEHAGHFVNVVHIPHGDHATLGHVGEEGDFCAFLIWNGAVCSTNQCVGLDANFSQFLRSVLGGFGLEFTRRRDPGHITQVHKRC